MTLLNEYYVWAREDDSLFPFKCRIGNNAYFSIVGHTPNNKRFGYFYNSKENYLNIDGGSAYLHRCALCCCRARRDSEAGRQP